MYSPTIGFGLVPAGQPINLNPNKLSDTKFAFIVNNEKRVNHVAVFLSAPLLPEAYGAGVFFELSGQPPFYLGMLTNDKPSTIFRLSEVNAQNFMIGISIEPLSSLDSLELQKKKSSSFGAEKNMTIANPQKMLENLFNYVMSFSTSVLMPNQEYVPANALKKWYEITMKKLEQDPSLFK